MTDDPAIDYRRVAIEDLDFPAESFDVVLSSLAFHYVADIAAAFATVRRVLKTGGRFVLSVEHPVFTARAEQSWFYGPDGEIVHWPVDDYQAEGIRHASWLADDVVKYHRTVASWINTLIDSGFAVAKSFEWEKRWHPEIEDPEIAIPHYAKVMREYLTEAGIKA